MGTHQCLVAHYIHILNGIHFAKRTGGIELVDGGRSKDHYQAVYLSHIAAHFSNMWDATVARGTDMRGVTPTVLDLVKNKIIKMLVCMHHILLKMLDRIAL